MNSIVTMKSKILYVALILALSFTACESDDLIVDWQTATILDRTDAAQGGCGFTILVGGLEYVPNYLPGDFQQGGTEVSVQFELLNETVTCGTFPDQLTRIRIIQIRLR